MMQTCWCVCQAGVLGLIKPAEEAGLYPCELSCCAPALPCLGPFLAVRCEMVSFDGWAALCTGGSQACGLTVFSQITEGLW